MCRTPRPWGRNRRRPGGGTRARTIAPAHIGPGSRSDVQCAIFKAPAAENVAFAAVIAIISAWSRRVLERFVLVITLADDPSIVNDPAPKGLPPLERLLRFPQGRLHPAFVLPSCEQYIERSSADRQGEKQEVHVVTHKGDGGKVSSPTQFSEVAEGEIPPEGGPE